MLKTLKFNTHILCNKYYRTTVPIIKITKFNENNSLRDCRNIIDAVNAANVINISNNNSFNNLDNITETKINNTISNEILKYNSFKQKYEKLQYFTTK